MGRLTRIFASLGIVGVMCLSGYLVYNVAYARGETVGYDTGYSEGETTGYSSGKQDGYEVGTTEGYSLGKQEGYDEGYSSGMTDGYAQGLEAGLGHGYTLKDPTYERAVAFLRQDTTDKKKYIEDTYVCSHFARDACNNAEEQGLRCALVELRYSQKQTK